jgi:hypothetical protein
MRNASIQERPVHFFMHGAFSALCILMFTSLIYLVNTLVLPDTALAAVATLSSSCGVHCSLQS